MTKHLMLMKKQFDFLQEDGMVVSWGLLLKNATFLNFVGFFKELTEILTLKKRFLLLIFLFANLSTMLGQAVIEAKLSTPNTGAVDICAEVPIQIEATPMSGAFPLIWREKNNNGSFSDSLSHTNLYTPNPVTGTSNSRIDELIVTLDQGYDANWQNVTGIDTTGGKFECTIAGQGNSGARSVNTLSANTDGWVEAKLSTAVQATFGLSATNPDNNPSTIDFGIEISKGQDKAFVIENGVTPTSFTPVNLIAGEDIFRVERVGNKIIYKHNRVVFYTSTITSTSTLFVDVSMNNVGESLDMDVSFGNNSHIFPADTIKVQVLKAINLDIGTDKEICEGQTTTVSFALDGAAFDQWKFVGGSFNTTTRTFTPNNSFTTPTRIDTVIAFSFPASNSVCPAVADTVLITVRQTPTISITTVADATTNNTSITDPIAICEEDSVRLIATPGGNADTIFWTTNNGSFNITDGITNTTATEIKYLPVVGQATARRESVYLKTDSDFSVCPAALDTIDVEVHLRGEVANSFERASVCQGDSIQLAATLSRGATSLKWEIKIGNGTFSSIDTITNPFYLPSGTIDSVRFDTLLVKTVPRGIPMCDEFTDTVIISVFELDDVANSFDNFTICEGDSVNMNAIVSNVAHPVQWTIKTGSGFFLNSNQLDAVYIPTDITTNNSTRNDTLLVTTVPANSVCQPSIDTVVVTIHNLPQLSLSQDTTICIADSAFVRSINPRGIFDNIVRWDTLNGGVATALIDQSPNDTIVYNYRPTVAIDFPALSRMDTIVATTGKPNIAETAISSGQTCKVAIDTTIITVIDTANISIVLPNDPICELDTDTVKAMINGGATAVTWKLWPSQTGNGMLASIDSVTTKYTPNNIPDTLLSSRIDTLLAISVGSTSCPPDTAYAYIDVRNAPQLGPITDQTICDLSNATLETAKLGPGEFDQWTVQPAGIGTFNSTTAFPKVTYNPVDFASTIKLPRVDTIFFTTKDTSAYCPAYRDSVFVTINPRHQVMISDAYGSNSANLDTIPICEGSSTSAIDITIGRGTTSVSWRSIGNRGTFNNANINEPIYTPTIGQTTDSRYDTLIVSSSNSLTPCPVVSDSIVIHVQRAAGLSNVPDTVVCESGSVQLTGLSTGIGDTLFWNIVSGGQFQNTQTKDTTTTAASTIIYQPAVDVITQFRIDTITYSTTNPDGVCMTVEDSVFVSVFNAPTIEVDDPNKDNDTLYVCEGIGLSLDGAYGGGAVGATWSVLSNMGMFSAINNDTIATYTPNPGITTGATRIDTVILTSDIIAGTCGDDIAKDTLYVIVQKGPVVTAITDSLTMCEGNTINLEGSFGSIATGFTWSNKILGSGNINVLSNTTATYTPVGSIPQPGRLDILYLTSNNGNATCLTAIDSVEIFVSANPILDLGPDVSMCGNLTQVLTPSSIGVGNQLTWTSTDGTFATNPSPTGLYQPDFTVPTSNRPDGIIVTSIDSLGLCTAIKDTMIVTVYGLARVAIGSTGVVCEDDSLTLNASFAGTVNDFTYAVSNNSGTIAVANNQLHYIPNENTTQNNRIDELIIDLGDVDGLGACPSIIDTIDITVLNTPRATLIEDTTICSDVQVNLLIESFGLIDTFKSNFSNSLINYPSTPVNLPTGILRDTVLYGTSLIDNACPAAMGQVIVTIQNPGTFAIDIPDTTICVANTLALTTGVSNPNNYTFRWTVANNNGTFDDSNKATPTYQPNPVSTTSRVDTIMVEVVDITNICNVGLDTLLVIVVPSATLTDFRDTTICEGETLNLLASVNGSATFFWSSNSGTFADSSATQTTYTHAPVNGGNGLDIITGNLVFADDACIAVQKNLQVTVIGESAVNAGNDTTLCTGIPLQLSGTVGLGIDSVEWLVLGNAGTFDTTKSLTAVYTPAPNGGTIDRVDEVILSTTVNLTCIAPLDTIRVTVKPVPSASLGADQLQVGTADVILNAITSAPVVVSQWNGTNGSFINPTLNQAIYSPNDLLEGTIRLDTIVYNADFDIPGCSIGRDTLVITFEALPLITEANTDFCQSLCLDSTAVNINEMTNTAVVLASDINPFDSCSIRTDLTMKLWYDGLQTPEPSNISQFSSLSDSILFDCGDKGYQNVNVYITSDSTAVQLCPTVIKIEDAFISCGERIIGGRITTFKGDPVEGFQVFVELTGEIGGVVPSPVFTDADGRYEFTLAEGQTYRISPRNNENLAKGVTVFDNVVISRHILGLEIFNSPYQTIAADVNKSGTVTAFDIVEIRKIVLDRVGEFSNNTSWRFVDASFPFTDVKAAAAAPFEESFLVNGTMGNNLNMDFIAVKIGDVNGSNFTSGFDEEEAATSRNKFTDITFGLPNLLLEKGKVYEIPFQLYNVENVEGYQFTLDFSSLELLDILSGVVTKDHFGTKHQDRGKLTTCWSTANPATAEEAWFTLKFRATETGYLSKFLTLNSDITPMEGYRIDRDVVGVQLDFIQPIITTFELFQNKPNPFKEESIIGFALPQSSKVNLMILDMQGKVIQTIEGDFTAGYNEIVINMNDLSQGIFYYRLETVFGTKIQKMMHLE